MDTPSVTTLAEELIAWSETHTDKHPRDRLSDHEALDIALRMLGGHEPAGSTGFTTSPDGIRHRKLGE